MKPTFELTWWIVWSLIVTLWATIILGGMSLLFTVLECESAVTVPRPQFGTYPPDCKHLYNVGRSEDWAECMGVGLVSPNVRRELRDEMRRADL